MVRMPFSAPPLPGGWALDWGRARTGEEIGWSAKRSHARRGSTHRAERLRAGGVEGLSASGMDDVYLDRYVDHDTRQRAGMRR